MPIVFDEVTADIAPSPAARDAAAAATPPAANEVDAMAQLRRSLALLREREARLIVD